MTSDPSRIRFLLLGAGPSSLAFASAAKQPFVILEKEGRPGGLCRSFTVDGGVFDLGGHSFHTPHDTVFDLVQSALDGGLQLQKRNATVFTHGKLIGYPFQEFFGQIDDPKVVEECQRGLDQRTPAGSPPAHLEEFILQKFGQGIADQFMLPYNRKLWARDIRTISCDWTAQRVADPKGAAKTERFKTTGGGVERRPLQADSTVGYPSEGGFEQIFVRMADRVGNILCNQTVVSIDSRERRVTCREGSVHDYETLVSSMPLPELLRCIEGTPDRLHALAAQLECMSLRVEFLLVGRRLETEIQRIYCADPEIPPHKIALNHNSSDSLRAVDRHAIMAEVSVSPEKPLDTGQIAPRTVGLLRQLGILRSERDVIWTGHQDIRYGYPIYTHQRPAIVAEIKEWLAARDIHTVGRFGEWEYINSDKCILKGMALARDLRADLP
jgi:protoporphyrinogen oxidase